MVSPRLRRAGPVAGTILVLAFAVWLVGSAVVSRDDLRQRLAEARPGLLIAGLALCLSSFAARGLRLNLLLPAPERLPFPRAVSVSAAANFLYHVVPFRGGEPAALALYRASIGVGWLRAGAIYAMVRAVDAATLVLAGLLGGAVLSLRHGHPALGAVNALGAGATATFLLGLPLGGGRVLTWLGRRLPEGRPRQASLEVASALAVAVARPGLYAGAISGALAFLAVSFAGTALMLRGLGATASLAGVAFASWAASLPGTFVPSPAGTFGTMEPGYAAALAVDGLPVATAAVAMTVIHALTVAATGVLALPALLRARRR